MKGLLLALCVCLESVLSANILMLTMGGTKSHKMAFLALGKGLKDKGHKVTLVSPFPPSGPSPVHEIAPLQLELYVRNFTNWDLLGRRMRGETTVSLFDAIRYGGQACEAFFSSKEISRILSLKVDLLVLDGAFPECLLGLVHHFKVPFAYINTVAFYTRNAAIAGSPMMYSVTPFLDEAYSDRMSFWERSHSALRHLFYTIGQLFTTKVLIEPVVREHLGSSVPSLFSIGKNVSLILQHGHHSITYPRPYLPNVVEVACLHCQPARPLPKDLEEFVTGGAKKGFVLVSFGTSVKSQNMPEALRLMMVSVFSALPYQVLWRYEEYPEDASDLPINVRLGRWLPQQDLLGHPQMLALVGHGGLLSVMEAVYHGVPLVAMPIFCDQEAISHKAQSDGYAVTLQLKHLNSATLLAAINKVITDKSYKANAMNRSVLLRDQAEEPVHRAIYWLEYVLRHNGAPHLQGAAKDLTLVQYFMLDTLAALALAVYIIVKVLAVLIRWLMRRSLLQTKVKIN